MESAQAKRAQRFTNVGHSLNHLLTLLYPTIVLTLETEWQRSYGELIGLMLVGQILYGAVALPAGWLGDRWSTLGMMVAYFVGTGAAAILAGLATTPFQLALGLAAIGFFGAIYHPVGMAWLVRSSADRGKALGWNGMFGSFGVALGPAVAGALCQWWSWRAAFIVPGVVTALVGLALLAAWRTGLVVERAHDIPQARKPASRNEVMRAFILLSVTMTCAGLIYQAFTVILPKLFAERIGADFGLGASAIGGLVGLVYLFAGLTMPISGRLADRFPTTQIYRLAFVLIAPCLFLAAMLQSWPLVIVTVALVILNTLSGPAENKLLAFYTPGRWQGTGYGAKFVLSLGVSASAIPLIALVYDATGGFVWLFVAMGVLALMALVAALMLPAGEPRAAAVASPAPRVAAAE
jgi:FSR family fosmidomycin resistance protein-like MFS transporter